MTLRFGPPTARLRSAWERAVPSWSEVRVPSARDESGHATTMNRTAPSIALCAAIALAACSPARPPATDDRATAPQPIATSATPSSAPSSAVTPTPSASPASLTPPECTGANEQLHGSTCCEKHAISEQNKYPGQVFLDCHGPQIGRACSAKTDCDVVCSCEPDSGLKSPRDDPAGPKDGTRGAQGRCSGRLQIGVWMCQIDEKGVVTHVIVD